MNQYYSPSQFLATNPHTPTPPHVMHRAGTSYGLCAKSATNRAATGIDPANYDILARMDLFGWTDNDGDGVGEILDP